MILFLQDGPKVLAKVDHCDTFEVPDVLGYHLECPVCSKNHVVIFNYHGPHDDGAVFVMTHGQPQNYVAHFH